MLQKNLQKKAGLGRTFLFLSRCSRIYCYYVWWPTATGLLTMGPKKLTVYSSKILLALIQLAEGWEQWVDYIKKNPRWEREEII